MVSDTLDTALDEDLEEETEEEVNKVMAELAGEISSLPAAKRPVKVVFLCILSVSICAGASGRGRSIGGLGGRSPSGPS